MHDYRGRRCSRSLPALIFFMDAYLDIETSFEFKITVIGLYRKDKGFQQLMGQKVNRTNLTRLVTGVDRIVTYNGSRFDLPVIKRKLSLDLRGTIESLDLMYLCWKKSLYGGLKKVEKILGIPRQLPDIDGQEAMRLWYWYQQNDDRHALRRLLGYNKEDVMNLIPLHKKLGEG